MQLFLTELLLCRDYSGVVLAVGLKGDTRKPPAMFPIHRLITCAFSRMCIHVYGWCTEVLVYTVVSGGSTTFSALLSFLFSSLWIRRQDQIWITAACSFIVWAQDNPSPCCYHHIPNVRSAHLHTKCSWFQSNLVWWDSEHVFYGRAQFLFREDPLINVSLPHYQLAKFDS